MNSFVVWTIAGAVVSIALVYLLISLGVLPSASGTGVILWVIVVVTQIRANRTKPDAPAQAKGRAPTPPAQSALAAPFFALGMSVFYVGSAFGAGWLGAAIAGHVPPERVQQGVLGVVLMVVGIGILSALALIAARAVKRRSAGAVSE